MLLALWSPKGGSGTSVLAAVARSSSPGSRRRPARRPRRRPTGDLRPRRRAASRAPRLARRRSRGAQRGARPARGRGGARCRAAPARRIRARARTRRLAEAGAALAVALRDGPIAMIVDCGARRTPRRRRSSRSPTSRSSSCAAVTSRCGARCAAPALARTVGVVLVEETDRSLTAKEVADVLDLPVLARVPVKMAIFRAVDAGVLAGAVCRSVARPASVLVRRVGLVSARRGSGRMTHAHRRRRRRAEATCATSADRRHRRATGTPDELRAMLRELSARRRAAARNRALRACPR